MSHFDFQLNEFWQLCLQLFQSQRHFEQFFETRGDE